MSMSINAMDLIWLFTARWLSQQSEFIMYIATPHKICTEWKMVCVFDYYIQTNLQCCLQCKQKFLTRLSFEEIYETKMTTKLKIHWNEMECYGWNKSLAVTFQNYRFHDNFSTKINALPTEFSIQLCEYCEKIKNIFAVMIF